jgi:cytochrome c biogenesis protein CcmG, thiol:disulfide interchange protein DsbE
MRPALVVLALVALLPACSPGADAADPSLPDVSAADTVLEPCPRQPGRQVREEPAMPNTSLPCVGGGTLDLGVGPGAPTLVNLWGSWCAPCREELPLLQQFADEMGDRVRVIGVISKDGLPQAESFAADAGITFPGAFDAEGRLMTMLGINALPYTYFLTADGTVAYTQVGPVTSVDELRALVAEHLGVRP